MNDMNDRIKKIEHAIGYEFNNKELILTAFTHASFSNENNASNNEKLEFLGDSLLNFIVSEKLFESTSNEGALTAERAKIVSAIPLANAVKRLNIMEYMRLGAGMANKSPSPKFYSDLFEAIVGAIYLDGGMDAARDFIFTKLWCEDLSKAIDYKTKLQEFAQKTHKNGKVIYADHFDENKKLFVSTVFVFGRECGVGCGVRKKEAEQNAALEALKMFKL